MKNFSLALASIGMTAFSWGVYGPLMQEGAKAMGHSRLLPFIGVGVAYFLIAVLAAGAFLRLSGESGQWNTKGIIWSLVAGIVTSVGALGIILALTFGGSPLYVMPLVFGCAPVVNTFLTMFLNKTNFKQGQPLFYAGLILVIAGAVTVLVFKPGPVGSPAAAHAAPAAQASAPATTPATTAAAKPEGAVASAEGRAVNLAEIVLFIAMTALCWGSYGPILHKGQVLMGGSRLRPFICVGIAYFLIAVLLPLALLPLLEKNAALTFSGSLWSLGAGTAGALGSLGIILAFNFGGKPIYVMPLVFGGAPVINTLTSIAMTKNLAAPSPLFYAGLIIVLAGAVTVLVFAPKGGPKVPGKPAGSPQLAGAK
jgi:nitrate reductase gamma subunit